MDAVSQHARAFDTLHNQCYEIEMTKPMKESANRNEWLAVFPSLTRASSALIQALETLGVVLRRYSFATDLAVMVENAMETAQDLVKILKSLKQSLPPAGSGRPMLNLFNNNNNNNDNDTSNPVRMNRMMVTGKATHSPALDNLETLPTPPRTTTPSPAKYRHHERVQDLWYAHRDLGD